MDGWGGETPNVTCLGAITLQQTRYSNAASNATFCISMNLQLSITDDVIPLFLLALIAKRRYEP